MLEIEGCETRTAFSGPEALKVAEEFQPDVALLDIGMPGLTGYDVARMLRSSSRTAEVFLVAVTGWGQAHDKQAAHDAGFDAHLTKPINLQQVIDLIAVHARQKIAFASSIE
jgi:CheY-like chemotaxis protein